MIALRFTLCILLLSILATPVSAQKQSGKKKSKQAEPFAWVNKIAPNNLPPNVNHATFRSRSMDVKVGYFVYLPTAYRNADAAQRFPVVYVLHGGRPGSEKKMAKMAKYYHEHMKAGAIAPTIYVFPNGGPVSWYNFADRKHGMGEDVFINELIPHIDATYRTIAKREGRAIEGFSQGGRGTTRLAFKHPDLFVSAAPGGSGYGPEKHIRDHGGKEVSGLQVLPIGNNCWDLAKVYSEQVKRGDAPMLEPLLWVGTKGFNYETNLEFGEYLTELGIPHTKVVVEDATHSAAMIYDKKGLEIMQHHQRNFVRPEGIRQEPPNGVDSD